ncbi:MAG: secretin N-terminal domain-containing protein [Vicinamibacteria bacterium]
MAIALAATLLAAVPSAAPAPSPDGETRISIDVKDASIVDVVLLLAEVGGFQVVIDPGVSCQLTLSLKQVRWSAALEHALRSCGLGIDGEGGIYRVAPVARLTAEAALRRKLAEEKSLAGPLTATWHRLSYARAVELAPLLGKFLSPRGAVVVDQRTNTLIVIDVAGSR